VTPFLENGPDLVAKRRSIAKHDGGLGSITEKPCAESCENAGSQNEPTHHGDHSRILQSVPSTIAHTRFLITATLLCHLILALVLVTTWLLSPVLASDEGLVFRLHPPRRKCQKPIPPLGARASTLYAYPC
jgi:hypothetical protein